jgi:hypothetical protein
MYNNQNYWVFRIPDDGQSLKTQYFEGSIYFFTRIAQSYLFRLTPIQDSQWPIRVPGTNQLSRFAPNVSHSYEDKTDQVVMISDFHRIQDLTIK